MRGQIPRRRNGSLTKFRRSHSCYSRCRVILAPPGRRGAPSQTTPQFLTALCENTRMRALWLWWPPPRPLRLTAGPALVRRTRTKAEAGSVPEVDEATSYGEIAAGSPSSRPPRLRSLARPDRRPVCRPPCPPRASPAVPPLSPAVRRRPDPPLYGRSCSSTSVRHSYCCTNQAPRAVAVNLSHHCVHRDVLHIF